jgi:glutamine amidotransferase
MITLIDYNAGNLTSVRRALEYLGIKNRVTRDPELVRRSERIIFPGVGHAAAAMEVLRSRGLDQSLAESVRAGTPTLGICIGSQVILSYSEEGDTPGLGLLPGVARKFELGNEALKIPHMGWNAVEVTRPHPLLAHLHPGDEFYFVHSYYPRPTDPADVYAVCEYGVTFPAAVGRESLFAVQFHAEKSGPAGLQVLKNFAEWQSC